ncbi:DUF3238 domain-containing protein [Bhargavaea ullalensis]|uniref:DUF3238 domain-containing protein n=1 Tax=Bhargavaea ullalensis TaxID=1265685 RepID=A0ABV2G7N7_9BACL
MEQADRFEIRSVVHREGLIEFDWDDPGESYRVYKEGRLVQEGPVCDFTDEDVMHGKMYHYAVECLDGRERVTDVIRMQTSALKTKKDTANPVRQIVFTTIVAKSQIALAWEKIPQVKKYEVYRDGILLEQTEGTHFIDREVPDAPSVYAIRAERPAQESEEPLSSPKTMLGRIAGLFNPESSTKEDVTEEFWMTKMLGRPSEMLLPVEEWREPDPVSRWKFRYTTFLAEEKISNPNILSPNRTFDGDGREFDPEGESFRTRADVTLSYTDRGYPLVFTKEAGKTVAYGISGRKREEGRASIEDFTIEPLEHDGREFGFVLEHSVGNPITPAPTIDYEVHAVLRQHGTFEVTGYHDQAPHHEVYLDKGDGWFPIHRAESKGLAHMSEVIAYQHWNTSSFE